MSKIIQGNFKILSNQEVGPGYFKMAIYAPEIARRAQAGQFVHLRCSESIEPLLRRPFSLHRLNRNNFELLYKVVGRGTQLLRAKQKGERVDVLGPLGHGFTLIRNTKYEIRNTILVAGGMGVAPLLALAQVLSEACCSKNIRVLLGARRKEVILCARDFKELGLQVALATDDGSRGFQGPVTDLLVQILQNTKYKIQNTIYACGPRPMLKEVARIARKFRLLAFASWEEQMACGVGACRGCVVETRSGYQRVCTEGPVFNLQEIKWQS